MQERTCEQLAAEDNLFQGTGLDDGRVKGRVGAKETREEEPASQRDPHTAQAKGLTLDLVGTQLVSAP